MNRFSLAVRIFIATPVRRLLQMAVSGLRGFRKMRRNSGSNWQRRIRFWQESRAVERLNDSRSGLQLELQRIGNFAVKALSPDLRLIADTGEPCGEANSPARRTEAAFHHGSHTQVLADLGDCFG